MNVPYPISDIQKAEFASSGHILLEGVATNAFVRQYRPIIRDACMHFGTETRPIEERDTYGKAFLQTTNLWQRDQKVRDFVFQSRFAEVAATLLGVEKVRLYHDQALFKEPGGGPTPWHQDQYYWPLDTDRTITMWMPLVDIDSNAGMLTFASGSHRGGAVDDLAISDESDRILAGHVADKRYPVVRAERMAAGDATFHLGLTIHTAGGNGSEIMREVMTIIYFADQTRITEPRNSHQRADLETWLRPRMPGQLADGELNPVLN